MLANNVDPDQMPHYVASDLGLHCLSRPFYGFPGKKGFIVSEMVLVMGHIIRFCGEKWTIIRKLSLLTLLIWNSTNEVKVGNVQNDLLQ